MNIVRRLNWFQWFFVGLFILLLAGTTGLGLGYWTGTRSRALDAAVSSVVDIQTQFELGLQDYKAGRFSLARQRLDYVLSRDPDYPGAAQYLAETLLRLKESGVQVTDVIQPTATLSPTPDTRAVEELFAVAMNQLTGKDWHSLVQTVLALRNIDALYRVTEVDRMLFLGLRFGGIQKILDDGDLEGGLYDLALAEQFAPLDAQAGIYQEWARLYQIGVSFWGVLPERSVYYFSQLAAAAPYLHDLSGIYAQDRYRMALVQYGDQLAQAEEWCAAYEAYDTARILGGYPGLQPTLTFVDEKCQYSIATPTFTPSPTVELTATPTITPTGSLTVTWTSTPVYTHTPSPTVTPTIETPATASPTATPTATPMATPTATPSATQIPIGTPTPSATATATPTQESAP